MFPKIRVHPLFLLLGVVMIAAGSGYEFGVYSVLLLLHEGAHSFAAYRLGFTANKIELLPYGAVLYGVPTGIAVKDEIKIALAGPAASIVIALVCIAFWWIVPDSYAFTDVVVAAGLTTGIFNLLPAYPLDGGRAALALLSLRYPYKKCLRAMKMCGAVLSLVIFGLYIGSLFFEANVTLALISFFLMQGALYDLKENSYNKVLSERYKQKKLAGGITGRTIYVSGNMSLRRLISTLNHNYYYDIVITDTDFNEQRRIKQKDLNDLILKNSLYTPLKDCFSTKSVLQ